MFVCSIVRIRKSYLEGDEKDRKLPKCRILWISYFYVEDKFEFNFVSKGLIKSNLLYCLLNAGNELCFIGFLFNFADIFTITNNHKLKIIGDRMKRCK